MAERQEWDEEVDLVCVGSGGAAFAGAVTAALGGARVLVLEKTEMLGGLTCYSEGEIWVPANFVQAREGADDSVEEALEYLDFLSAGLGDAQLRRHFLAKTREAVEYFEEHADLGLSIMPTRVDYFFPDGPGSKGRGRYLEVEPFDARRLGSFEGLLTVSPYNGSRTSQGDIAAVGAGRDGTTPESMSAELAAIHARREADHEVCGGAGLVARLMEVAIAHGVQIRTGARVERLHAVDGAVVGVAVSTAQGPLHVGARAVLLATGGYDWNHDLVQLYEQRADLYTLTPPNQSGDHMVMGGEVGAAVALRPASFTPLINGFRITNFPAPGEVFDMPIFTGRPHTIFVNKDGRRFADESFYPALHAVQAMFDGVTMTYPNLPTWYVFDQNYRDKFAFPPFPAGVPLPDDVACSAGTVEELAQMIGVDAGNFVATIERFNRFSEQGHDDDFGRGTRAWSQVAIGDESVGERSLLGALDKPPFYAIKLNQLTAGVASAGLKIDGSARVVGSRGLPIPGLYAAGNAAGVVDVIGYQSGTSISRGLAHGYLAARDALVQARAVPRPPGGRDRPTDERRTTSMTVTPADPTTFVIARSDDTVVVIERFSIPDADDLSAALATAERHIAEQWRGRGDYAGSLLLRHRKQTFNIFSGPGNVPGLAVYSRWRRPADGSAPATVADAWSLRPCLPGVTVIDSRTFTVDFTESLTEGSAGTPVSLAAAPIAHMGIFTRIRAMEPLLVEARTHSKESFRAGGVIGVNFHPSVDGEEAINFGQWTTVEHLEKLADQPGFGASNFYWEGLSDGHEGMFFDVVAVDPGS